jgi:flagellar L-ring protein precursor FlgH
MRIAPTALTLLILVATASCGRVGHIGKPPGFTADADDRERVAMISSGIGPIDTGVEGPDRASLWSASQQSLLGDRRAMKRGDILTVVIEIDEQAEISNSSQRSRSGSESLGVPQLFGLPQRAEESLAEGATMTDPVSIDSSSSSSGDGSVRRREELTLRIAATVIDVLPNDVLAIRGVQEVRVNFEMRQLFVSGYVRPEDISRQNEITYDKIASARISYGGRGQISDMQQPRIGQQVLDALLPF